MNWLPLLALLFFFQGRKTTPPATTSDKSKKPDPKLTAKSGPGSGGAKSVGSAAWKNGSRTSPPTPMFMTNQLTDWWSSYVKFKRIWDAANPPSTVGFIPDAWGTDEAKMLSAIKSLNANERKYLCRGFPFWYWDATSDWWRNTGHSLVWIIEDELDSDDLATAKQSLSCIQV